MHKGFWRGPLRERDDSEDLNLKWEDNLKMDLKEVGWTGMDSCFSR